MSYSYNNYTYPNSYANRQGFSNVNFRKDANGRPILTKPIEAVESGIHEITDIFVPQSENKEVKKTRKKAITVTSAVLVATGLAALLNPKISGKFIDKLQNYSSKLKTKNKSGEGGALSKFFHKTTERFTKTFQFVNSMNAEKDQIFKTITSKEKTFDKVKNKTFKNVLIKCDKAIRTIFAKPCQLITDWFERIAKKTVCGKYNSANKKMDLFEKKLIALKDKHRLNAEDSQKFEKLMQEIKNEKSYYSETELTKRLNKQGELMSDLETEFDKKWKTFIHDFKKPNSKEARKHNKANLSKNMTFWAEDILQPTKDNLEKVGINKVDILLGNKSSNGKYKDLVEIFDKYLTKDQQASLRKDLDKVGKKLRTANHKENFEYFDKKRDLVLGGGPMDILSNLGSLGLAGVAIAATHNKEDKTTRALTIGMPAAGGIATSMIFTARLYSGVKSLLAGGISGVAFSILGSVLNKHINPKNQNQIQEINQQVPMEVINA